MEVPLGGGAGGGDGEPEGDSLEGSPTEEGGAGGQQHRAGVGFFFKDEDKEEALMAQRRAALLERQQRRSAEVRQRRQWESERRGRDGSEHRAVPSDPPRPEEDPPRRGDFTRQEYERRQQLKLMADLDKVLRPPRSAPPRGAPPRRPRPKSVFCDDSALARSPAKGALGARLSKVYSQSTLSLSTVTAEAAGTQSGKGASRAASPSAPISPGRAPPGKEREWENGSTASSPASGQEYTGPRLYKEPSAKSNKHIIHNALAHCCLAGRANEQQKNRVLEEVEKSSAQHFLILFRDGGCQFRALYTRGGGDPPELRRLAGWGPRAVPLPMVEGLYKYHSDRKRFSRIPATTMSLSVDAFTIPGHLWPPRKGGGGGGGGGRQGGGVGGSK